MFCTHVFQSHDTGSSNSSFVSLRFDCRQSRSLSNLESTAKYRVVNLIYVVMSQLIHLLSSARKQDNNNSDLSIEVSPSMSKIEDGRLSTCC